MKDTLGHAAPASAIYATLSAKFPPLLSVLAEPV